MPMRDQAGACGEVWQAADALEFPVSMEERLRGGDRKIEACLLVETLRVPDAETIAVALANAFPRTEIGVYRLLCEIRADGPPRMMMRAVCHLSEPRAIVSDTPFLSTPLSCPPADKPPDYSTACCGRK